MLYKVLLVDGVDVISRGRQRERRGDRRSSDTYELPGTAFATAVCFVYLVLRSDDVCLMVELAVKMLSCRSSLSYCAPITHIHRDCWHKGKNIEHGRRCTAAEVLLYADFVTVHAPRTHT